VTKAIVDMFCHFCQHIVAVCDVFSVVQSKWVQMILAWIGNLLMNVLRTTFSLVN